MQMTVEDVLNLGKVPTMGGWSASFSLYTAAHNLSGEGCVVECGTWLGSSVIPVIWGLKDAGLSVPVHCFDTFSATEDQIGKAKPYGVTLKVGQDLLPIVLANLPKYDEFFAHRGLARDGEWVGRRIELYIDDCNKQIAHFIPAMKKFAPYWLPGKTLVVLMDYHFDESPRWTTEEQREVYRAQKNFVARHPNSFKSLGRVKNSTIEFFLFVSPIDFSDEKV